VRRPRGTRPPLKDVDLGDLPGEIALIGDDELKQRAALASTFESPSFVARGTEAGHIRLVRTTMLSRVEPVEEAGTPAEPPTVDEAPPVMLTAECMTPAASELEAPTRRRRSEEPNFTVRLPDYVQQALRMRAVSERTTVRLTLLKLLRGAGYHVDDEDMTDDRGIVAKMRAKNRQPT
jgi:hypothetical protein